MHVVLPKCWAAIRGKRLPGMCDKRAELFTRVCEIYAVKTGLYCQHKLSGTLSHSVHVHTAPLPQHLGMWYACERTPAPYNHRPHRRSLNHSLEAPPTGGVDFTFHQGR